MSQIFALTPGLDKVFRDRDWKQLMLATEKLPDYREVQFSSYTRTEDAVVRAGKLYYQESQGVKGGKVYTPISHVKLGYNDNDRFGLKNDFGETGKYEFAGYTVDYKVVNGVMKDGDGNNVRSGVRFMSAEDRKYFYKTYEYDTETHSGQFVFNPFGDLTGEFSKAAAGVDYTVGAYVTAGTWYTKNGSTYSIIVVDDDNHPTFESNTNYYRKGVITADWLINNTPDGILYYYDLAQGLCNLDLDAGAVTDVTYFANGAQIAPLVITESPDKAFIKDKPYYKVLSEAGETYGIKFAQIETSSYTIGEHLPTWEAEHGFRVYSVTNELFIANAQVLGTSTWDPDNRKQLWFERIGSKFPYEGFVAVSTEAASGQSKGGLYKCVESGFLLTEDTTFGYGVNGTGKFYYTQDDDKVTYSKPVDSSGKPDIYRLPDSDQFIQLTTDTVYKAGVEYFLMIDGELVEDPDYEVGQPIEDPTKVYSNNRKFFWRDKWKFTECPYKYGVTTDKYFQPNKDYYFYQGRKYDFLSVPVNATDTGVTICADEYFGYRALLDSETTYEENKTYGRFDGEAGKIVNVEVTAGEDISDEARAVTFMQYTEQNIPKYFYIAKADLDKDAWGAKFTEQPLKVGEIYGWDALTSGPFEEGVEYFLSWDEGETYEKLDPSDYEGYTDIADLISDYGCDAVYKHNTTIVGWKLDYTGTRVSYHSNVIYCNDKRGEIPTEVQVCVRYSGTGEDGRTMPYEPQLYLKAMVGEPIIQDEYYEATPGMYIWKQFFLDHGVSSTTVTDVKAYTSDNTLFVSWSDPKFMANAADPSTTPDAWSRTTLSVKYSGASGFVDLTNNVESDEFKNKYFTKTFTPAEMALLKAGELKLTAVSASGTVSEYLFKAKEIVWQTDKELVALSSSIALPGVVYYLNGAVVPTAPGATNVSGCTVKFQDDLPYFTDVVGTAGTSKVPYVVPSNAVGDDIVETGDTATDRNHLYVYCDKYEVTVSELARTGELKKLYGIGSVFGTDAVVAGDSSNTVNAMLVDFDSVQVCREFEWEFESKTGSVSADTQLYVRWGNDKYIGKGGTNVAGKFVKAANIGTNGVITSGTTIPSGGDNPTYYIRKIVTGKPLYQFYTKSGSTYTAVDYTAAGWEAMIRNRNNEIFVKQGDDFIPYEGLVAGHNATFMLTKFAPKSTAMAMDTSDTVVAWPSTTLRSTTVSSAVTTHFSAMNMLVLTPIKAQLKTVDAEGNVLYTYDNRWVASASQLGIKFIKNTEFVVPNEGAALQYFGENASDAVRKFPATSPEGYWTRTGTAGKKFISVTNTGAGSATDQNSTKKVLLFFTVA